MPESNSKTANKQTDLFCAPRLKGLLVSLALGKDGYDGFLANKKNTPLMDPKAPNISQAIM